MPVGSSQSGWLPLHSPTPTSHSSTTRSPPHACWDCCWRCGTSSQVIARWGCNSGSPARLIRDRRRYGSEQLPVASHWLAIAVGAMTLLGVVSIILFFTVGGVFGMLNDVCNGVEAILSALLVWRMHPWLRSHAPRLSRFSLIAAWVGALIASIGSALIILDFT